MAKKVKAQDADWRKWKRELAGATKREKDWLKQADDLYKQYRAGEKRKNAFNMLYANTATLRPALYNGNTQPDVRRRFRDSDPLGKAVSETLDRALTYSIDCYDFDNCPKSDTLDALITGRGVSRVRYVPSLAQHEGDEAGEAQEGDYEELEYEQVVCEHVDYRDFRHGYGRTWKEVEWVAFRHTLKKSDVREKFGDDIAEECEYETDREEDEKEANSDIESFDDDAKTAEFWEFWDKENKRVFFHNASVRELIYPVDNPDGTPPQDFREFFPIPKPLQLIEDSSSLVPVAPYMLYKEQADELNRLSAQINTVIKGLKLRGIYDSTLQELGQLMTAGDNDMIAVQNAQQYIDKGLDKAIAWLPIDMAAAVLKELYVAREGAKQIVYEVSGISDILRGATDAKETATAQQLKANYASGRLSAMQKTVEQYCKELVMLMAEVIAEKFQPETLATMTMLKFPTAEQKMQLKQQAALEQQKAQSGQQAQPMPPDVQEMLAMPTWEDIIGVMRDEMLRSYRVDVETDSSVKEAQEKDLAELRELLTGIVEFIQGIGPAVEAGAFPIEAVKAIVLSITRRARMGIDVEDALEKIKAPAQQSQVDPEQMKKQIEQQVRQQVEQENLQKMLPKEMGIMQKEQDLAQREMQLQVERDKMDADLKLAQEQMRIEQERAAMEVQKIVDEALLDMRGDLQKQDAKNDAAKDSVNRVEKAEGEGKQDRDTLKSELSNVMSTLTESHNQTLTAIMEAITKPRSRKIVRGKDGRAEGMVEEVT